MSFDRLAPHYRWLEALLAGNLLQRGRTHWLPEVRNSRRVLLAGEGHGRLLVACATALPSGDFTVLDQSEGMLRQARQLWHQSGGNQTVHFGNVDLRQWRSAQADFDLVVTNFFLDCFDAEELSRVIANLAAATAPQARWIVTDFVVPETGWRRRRAQIILALAYAFFRRATGLSARRLTSPDAILRAAGFQLQRRARFNHNFIQTDLWVRA